jgi:4-diphosphocytidyl-2-C-methyl-D-erythritol kinase
MGLFVTEKRPDNYHNIETVFYPVPLADILEIVESKKNEFTLSGHDIPGNRSSNLCLRAYDILRKRYQLPPVKIHLHKVIPTGAGLGGGSSNAAFTIKLLNDLFSINLNDEQMQEIAGSLGSDCSFFIKNKAVFATNKGDVFRNIDLDLSNYHILLVKPNIHISTPEAFSRVIPGKASFPLSGLGVADIHEWKFRVRNDFENNVFEKFPEIKLIKEKLYKLGAAYASMSGSGSCVYGIFEKPVSTINLFENCFVWQGKLK